MKRAYWVLMSITGIIVLCVAWMATLVFANPESTEGTPIGVSVATKASTIEALVPTARGTATAAGRIMPATSTPIRGEPHKETAAASPTPKATVKFTAVTLPKMMLASAGSLLEDFEKTSEWTRVSGNNPAADTVNVKNGTQSLKVSAGDSKTVVEKKVNWNLAQSPCVQLWVYREKRVSNSAFELVLSTTANYSQYFTKSIIPDPIDWTMVQICRDEFTSVRDAGWGDPIVKIRLQVNPNDEISFDGFTIGVNPIPAVMIHFDDANLTDYTVAFPILQKYGITATDYVPTSLVGTAGHMTVAQLVELQNNGWVIGNHTADHIMLRELDAAGQEREIVRAMQALESWGLKGGKHLSYPLGKYNTDTLEILKRWNFLSGRTVSNAPDVYPRVVPYILRSTQDVTGMSLNDVLKLVDEAQRNRRVLTLLFHELDDGQGSGDSWNAADFERLIANLAERKIQTLTIDEYMRLAAGGVKVKAPGGTK